jgi:hypothetical protein
MLNLQGSTVKNYLNPGQIYNDYLYVRAARSRQMLIE